MDIRLVVGVLVWIGLLGSVAFTSDSDKGHGDIFAIRTIFALQDKRNILITTTGVQDWVGNIAKTSKTVQKWKKGYQPQRAAGVPANIPRSYRYSGFWK